MSSAKVICDSISEAGYRLTTFEIEVPRIVWAEFMTHRMFSRNAASSRAIPFSKMIEQLTGKPARFGAANKGMQDGGVHNTLINEIYTAEEWWHLAKLSAVNFSRGFYEAGYAKQIFNRLTEPFQMIKGVVSATEWANFYWLRDDSAADPTIAELARLMREAHEKSVPKLLKAGEYHLPYVDREIDGAYYLDKESSEEISLEDAIKVSCARCAAASFRNVDYGVEKSREVYARLVSDDRIHGSALEHVATPMNPKATVKHVGKELWVNIEMSSKAWQEGVSHMDNEGNLWSGNFKGWIQYRKTIPGENYKAS
jgi:hypothetical protein